MKRGSPIALRVSAGLFMIYSLFMLWLLFVRGREAGVADAAAAQYNFVPLKTIAEMVQLLHNESLAWFALRNLLGNVLLFSPLGWFLPILWQRQRRFPVFLLTVAAVIAAVELLQWVLQVGVCDIDDWLANVVGACLGFAVRKLWSRKQNKIISR